MVDVYRVWSGHGNLTAIDRGVYLCNHRPRVRMGGRLAREVSSIKLRDGGIEVFEVERDHRREFLVGVDLDDHEHLGKERFDPFVATREGNTHEDKVPPAGRDDAPRYVCGPQLGDRPHVSHLGVSTMSDSRAHHPTAI